MTSYAFDADVLIYAAAKGHPLGDPVWRLLGDGSDHRRIGSVLLVPELLAKPIRQGSTGEVTALESVLATLELLDADLAVATLAAEMAAAYSLKALDAVHLATAVGAGADAFVTNNRRDFKAARIEEIDVRFPIDL